MPWHIRDTHGEATKYERVFSKLKCMTCNEATSSKSWGCGCGSLWIKCIRHMQWFAPKGLKRRAKAIPTQGVDKPFPKRRKLNREMFAVESQGSSTAHQPPAKKGGPRLPPTKSGLATTTATNPHQQPKGGGPPPTNKQNGVGPPPQQPTP